MIVEHVLRDLFRAQSDALLLLPLQIVTPVLLIVVCAQIDALPPIAPEIALHVLLFPADALLSPVLTTGELSMLADALRQLDVLLQAQLQTAVHVAHALECSDAQNHVWLMTLCQHVALYDVVLQLVVMLLPLLQLVVPVGLAAFPC